MPNYPETVFSSGSELELQRLGIFDAQGAYGARGDGTTNDSAALQAAINDALRVGGTVYLRAGTYLCLTPLTSVFPSNRTLRFQGDGMHATSIKAGADFAFWGMFGYTAGNQAQLCLADLTLDGNWSGAGGTLAQSAGGGAALWSIVWPFTDVNSPPATWAGGARHIFNRVRFYRPNGYGIQGAQGIQISECLFQQCGQPGGGGSHYDNIGSGSADAIVTNCTWLNSDGNYVDFVDGTDAARIKLIFTGNRSFGHVLGGIYGLGHGSIISDNIINNSSGGSGVGYDVGTAATNRGRNIVSNNSTDSNNNFRWLWVGAAAGGDQFYGNSDQTATATWDPPSLGTGAQTTTTVGLTNAQLGDRVSASFSLSLQAMQLTGYVSATDTVTVVLRNGTAGTIDLASGTLTVKVERG